MHVRRMYDLDPCSKAYDGNQDNANCNKADSPGKETNSQLLSSPWYLHASFFLPSCAAAGHAYYQDQHTCHGLLYALQSSRPHLTSGAGGSGSFCFGLKKPGRRSLFFAGCSICCSAMILGTVLAVPTTCLLGSHLYLTWLTFGSVYTQTGQAVLAYPIESTQCQKQ